MGLDQLFGPSVPLPARFIIVFVIVLALMAVFFWVLRRVFGGGLVSGLGRRGEQRIQVSEAVNLDGRRKLLIIRRDSVEHLVMIGGPNDLLIESQFARSEPIVLARGEPGKDQQRDVEPQMPSLGRLRSDPPKFAEPQAAARAAPPAAAAPVQAPPAAVAPRPLAPEPPRPQPAPVPSPVAQPAPAPRPQPIPPAPVRTPEPPAPVKPATPADIEREMANLLGAFQKPPPKT